MKEFRFAWNGRVMSKEDTKWILITVVVVLLSLIVILLAPLFG